MKKTKKNKVILIIRDGWGYRKSCKYNAICQADTKIDDFLMKNYPNTLLKASGLAVGLPNGYQGNSEVGHMAIGSGRILFQSLEKINKSIKDKSFFRNSSFLKAISNCKKNNSFLHLMILLQKEGVHSHLNHLFVFLDLCKKENFKDVFIHLITDGRDSPVNKSLKYVELLNKKLKSLGFGIIATISGRYYAMDRNKNWDRTKVTYDCIAEGKCKDFFCDILKIIKKKHKKKETDEFIIPCKKEGYSGINKGDSVVFLNFRTDRTRQLTQAFVEKNFSAWKRKRIDVFFVCMFEYYKGVNAEVAFKESEVKNILGEVISRKGLSQLRISETEKYAHVTFFFNCQKEVPFKNEKRILIPSPNLKTYDLKPEMSIYKMSEVLVKCINKKNFDFIVVNLVNCDMVGHTGNFSAIKKAVYSVDDCVGKISASGLKNDYVVLISADHGNAEDQRESQRTSHTCNKVPFILVSDDSCLRKCSLRKNRGLRDIAPTILDIMGIKKPEEMSGKSLIERV
jgi:2,3-bisphosphoglycerate-independent phosphoglycerate mutase